MTVTRRLRWRDRIEPETTGVVFWASFTYNELVDDGFHRVFVNTKVDDGTDIARLMRCFLQEEMNDPKFPRTSERVHMLKHSEGGVKAMCAIMEEYAKEYAEQYAKESDKKTVRHLLQNGVSFELVKASISSLSEKELLEIYNAVRK